MLCDRYELRDDVMPGAGLFRGDLGGGVKKQRILTDGFITQRVRPPRRCAVGHLRRS